MIGRLDPAALGYERGARVRIKGERGLYVVQGAGRCERDGSTWLDLTGGRSGHWGWRSVPPGRVVRASRARRGGRVL